MEFLKSITGKIVSSVVALAVVAGGISWWRTDEATRQQLVTGTGRIISWFLVILLLPWALFWAIGQVNRLESNAAGGLFVAALTALEAAGLAWLFGWSIHGGAAWVFFTAAVLVAGVYNLLTCDWIAEKVG